MLDAAELNLTYTVVTKLLLTDRVSKIDIQGELVQPGTISILYYQ
jgi:hypothetical protein